MAIYEWIVYHNDFIGIIIDFLSLIATITLAIVIYCLERKHEKDRDAAQEHAKENAIQEAAKVFLIDNDNEIEYLPLAVIANNLHLKRKHHRTVITRYLRCSGQLQQEILRQANITPVDFTMETVNTALENLRDDIKKNNFGMDILYDGGKYLHHAFSYWSEIPVEDVQPFIFEDLKKSESGGAEDAVSWRISNGTNSLLVYMWNYLHPEWLEIDGLRIQPPIDMVFLKCNLSYAEESKMTFWTMRIIIDACRVFKDLYASDLFDEGLIQNQEDMYYYTLAVLCKAYAPEKGEKDDQH